MYQTASSCEHFQDLQTIRWEHLNKYAQIYQRSETVFWFAIGVKFTTYQVLETKGVLFVKLSDGFTIGILGLSSMSLPTKELGIGYVELAFLAYFDSEEQVLWVEAQLTDASYLFHKSCRLTGGFALVSWFKRGEFLLSLGGYHPKFKAPSYYPVVLALVLVGNQCQS